MVFLLCNRGLKFLRETNESDAVIKGQRHRLVHLHTHTQTHRRDFVAEFVALRLKVSTDVDYQNLHLVFTVGIDIMTCPCTGTCSAVGPWTRATHAPEINQPSSSPVTTSKSPPCGLCYMTLHTHSLVLLVIICVDETSKNTSVWWISPGSDCSLVRANSIG